MDTLRSLSKICTKIEVDFSADYSGSQFEGGLTMRATELSTPPLEIYISRVPTRYKLPRARVVGVSSVSCFTFLPPAVGERVLATISGSLAHPHEAKKVVFVSVSRSILA